MAEDKPKRPEHVACSNCAFHHRTRAGHGDCRRRSPSGPPWHGTKDGDWCGEFMLPGTVPHWVEPFDPDSEVKDDKSWKYVQ